MANLKGMARRFREGRVSEFPRFVAAKQRPLPVIIMADVSGSMNEDGKIDVLNDSIAEMYRAFATEDHGRGAIHIAVVAFGGDGAYEHQKLTPATKAQWTDMQAGGPTPFGAALTLVGQMLRDETVVPGRAFNPALIVVSDGIPTDEWEEPLDELLTLPRGRNSLRLAVGVGAGMTSQAYAVLNRFIADESLNVFEAQDVNRIASFFRWVTVQVTRRVNSARPNEVAVIPLDERAEFGG
jgi:uncharacterized protein YegL